MSSVIEKSVIKTEAIFKSDKQHRYVLKKEWDKSKKKAMVIMINPSIATEVLIDHTTMFVMNNLSKLNFGGVDIVNLFSNVDGSRKTKGILLEAEQENDRQMISSADKVDSIIIAWGTIGNFQKCIQQKQKLLLQLLKPYEEKIFQIADGKGEVGFHPLAPQIRSGWNLLKFSWVEKQEDIQIKQTETVEVIESIEAVDPMVNIENASNDD